MPRLSLTPTAEQSLVIEAATSSKDNLLVSALAGAAKTTTLVMLAEALRGKPMLSVAFNASIAKEMQKRLPGHCQSATLNSIGHRAWGSVISARLSVDAKKVQGIVKDMLAHHPFADEAQEAWGDIIALTRRARALGYIPESQPVPGLIDRYDLRDALEEEEYDPLAWEMLDEIINTCIKRAHKGSIDFDDQIYMPTLFGAQWPRFPVTLVDEAQDLSPLNHAMLRQIVKDRRVIAVGDRFQSIYGFRGAADGGMDLLKDEFQMKELTLSISFRCPVNVVKAARFRAPQMQWAPNADTGQVNHFSEWTSHDIPDEAAILCRNNAPLISIALAFLRAGRGVDLKSFDISKRLQKMLEDLGPGPMPREEGLRAVAQWRRNKLEEGKAAESVIEDRAACLYVFVDSTETLGQAIKKCQSIFQHEGPIKLMTIHKSKGLEFDDVFILDEFFIGRAASTDAEKEQERNLRYVAITRAKKNLGYITSDNYQEL